MHLAAGYHAIYNVEWIGWDLVEPVTYTIGQGGFLLGMFYLMRNRHMAGSDYGDFKENYVNKRMQLSKSKEEAGGLIDDDRISLMKSEIAAIDAELAMLEKNRIY